MLILLLVTAAIAGFFIYGATRLAQPPMGLLYGDLAVSDSAKIVGKLEAMNVPYELRGGGTQIFVPSDQALRLRMAMAEEGLPAGGSIGYEVFDRSDSLGTTRSLQNINLLRALEGELARTIRSIGPIGAARVHLVVPKRELFSRDRVEPSASIVLTVNGGTPLTRGQVSAIQHLVAAAVPGLQPSRISIVDSRGSLLARGSGGEDDAGAAPSAAEDYRIGLEHRLKSMVEGLLERSVGYGKVRAEVSADIDFDRISTTAEIYDPDGQVVRSAQVVEEASSEPAADAQAAVTVADGLPDQETPDATGALATATSTRTEETTNYEISKTLRNEIRESGTVKRLSVAVLVDGTYDGADGTYQPRSPEELAQLEKLVRSAIGFDAKRGDTVEVVNMRFARVEPEASAEAPLLELGKGDYFKIAEIAVLFVVGILVVLLVLRPLATHALNPPAPEPAPPPALPEPQEAGGELTAAEESEQMIDLDNIEGKVKEASIKKIGEIVENHPNETLSIIRNWLYQQA